MTSDDSRVTRDIERLLRDALRTDRGAASGDAMQTMTAPAFRAVVAQRLLALERDLAEVRSRVNGLIFVVVGAVITQVLLRLAG